jgi:hypothetical protein
MCADSQEPSGLPNHQKGCVIFINTLTGGPQALTVILYNEKFYTVAK